MVGGGHPAPPRHARPVRLHEPELPSAGDDLISEGKPTREIAGNVAAAAHGRGAWRALVKLVRDVCRGFRW